MAIQGITHTFSGQQAKDRRYERDIKIALSSAQAYMANYASTSVTTTKGLLYSAGQSEISNNTSGTEWIYACFYTNITTGHLQIMNYYSGTTSTWASESISTGANVLPTSQWNVYRVPIYGNTKIDFNLSVTSAAASYIHLMTQEANGLF